MGRSQAKRTETTTFVPAEARDIRRHLQDLEQQLQQLRSKVAPALVERPAETSTPSISYTYVKSVIEARRARDRHFDRNLFGEPAWDMLLELFACELAQLRMTTSQLCVAAAVPATTALRWIGNLEQVGLIVRSDDPLDGRRVFVRLTQKGIEALSAYFKEVPAR